MKNEKLLLTIILSAITAVAYAPAIAKEKISFDIKEDKNNKYNDQIDTLLNSKASKMLISENIDSILDGYKSNNLSLKQAILNDVFKDTLLHQDRFGADSTHSLPPLTLQPQNQVAVFCHTACHGACHNSRGFR